MTTTAYAPARRTVSPAALLAGLRADRAAADAAEARILAGAVAWAEAHPARSAVDAAAHWEHGIGVPLAGDAHPWSPNGVSPSSLPRWACRPTPADTCSATPWNYATGTGTTPLE